MTTPDMTNVPPLPLTKREYPVAWEFGQITLWAKLALETQVGGDASGHRFLFRWNGFVGPAFRREEVERYAAWVLEQPNDELVGNPLYSWVEWDGAVAVVHDPSYPDDEPERLSPTAEGLYYLGEGWTWQIVEGEL
jgi:hypothetical protein